MNLNFASLFDDYRKQTEEIHSVKDALKLLEEKYGVDHEEVMDLYSIILSMIAFKFPNRSFEKKKNFDVIDSESELLFDAFFLGMFISDFIGWNWPRK